MTRYVLSLEYEGENLTTYDIIEGTPDMIGWLSQALYSLNDEGGELVRLRMEKKGNPIPSHILEDEVEIDLKSSFS